MLYFREKKNEFSLLLKIFLSILRFFAVFIISFMLLSPFLRMIASMKEKPVIIIALDNSQSMVMTRDSSAFRSQFPRALDEMSGSMSKIGEPRKYLFGEKLRPVAQGSDFSGQATFSERLTDFSGMISDLQNIFVNRNVGALVVVSDGIYNTGSNPVYTSKDLPFPVFTVALGDTSIRKDLVIIKVNYNRIVYLNDQFPVEAVVHAHASEGTMSKLRISIDGQQVGAQDVAIDRDDFTKTYDFVLEAKKSGLNKVVISLDPIEGEISSTNNRKEIFVEVLDSRNKVLILSAAPHPDISAIRQAISSNQNYEVEESLYKDFRGNPEAYNLIILHQLPSVNEPATELLKEITTKKLPVLYILGAKSDIPRFNEARSGLNLVAGKVTMEDVTPYLNTNFNAFSISEGTRNWLAGLPPLNSPLVDYQVSNAARILLFQRIGSLETSRPLVLFNETLEGRTGVIAGEGIWKWRLYDYARNTDHAAFNELINKMVQFLSLKEQKKQFRIYHKSNFLENEPVEFDAEIYNDSYELITDPDIGITIQNEEGKQFPFVFNRTGNSYHLNAGAFPPGNYSYVAKTVEGGQYPPESGQFSVTAIDLEALNTIADHHLLYQLAAENRGKMFAGSDLNALSEKLKSMDEIRPLTYTRKSYEDLINKWWVFGAVLVLLALEWFFRKRAGGY